MKTVLFCYIDADRTFLLIGYRLYIFLGTTRSYVESSILLVSTTVSHI